jgi:hypothetical protein
VAAIKPKRPKEVSAAVIIAWWLVIIRRVKPSGWKHASKSGSDRAELLINRHLVRKE